VPQVSSAAVQSACHLRRFVDFADPWTDDVCLDVASCGPELASAIEPRVRELTSADIAELPDGPFTLVTARLALAHADDPVETLRELLRVCGGRLVLADLVRTRTGDCSRIEHLRDATARTLPELTELTALLHAAGGVVRRLDVFTIERPIDPWLAGAADPGLIRRELTDELDGGPCTGARPRLIGGELWFAQSWAHLAVEPAPLNV
jgi:hypothetical protein